MRTTHTVATLEIPRGHYELIADKLKAAGYEHAFMHRSDGEGIDMSGIAMIPRDEPATAWIDSLALDYARLCSTLLAEKEPFQITSCIQVYITNALHDARRRYIPPDAKNLRELLGMPVDASEMEVQLALSIAIEKAKKFDVLKNVLK